MTRINILAVAPMMASAMHALDANFEVHRMWELPDLEVFFKSVGPKIRGIAAKAQAARIDQLLFDRLPNLEIIASSGVGYEHIDVEAATSRGLVVTNTPGVLDDEVADFAVGLLIATLRQIPQGDRFLRAGLWQHGMPPLSMTLRGRRVGIVGLGQIGRAIARRLEGFGVGIAYHGRSHQEGVPYQFHDSLLNLALDSDVLIVVVPGGQSTKHLINREILEALGPGGVLINLARGSVVDEKALISALERGTIMSAGLDVYENEPNVPPALIAIPQVVLLPHVGSATHHTREAMARLVVENLLAWFHTGRAVSPVLETMRFRR